MKDNLPVLQMHETSFVKVVGIKGAEQVTSMINGIFKTKSKESAHKLYTLVDSIFYFLWKYELIILILLYMHTIN